MIIDASVALSWVIPGENSELADQIKASILSHGAIVPQLWIYEIGNALLMSVRHKRIKKSSLFGIYQALQTLPIEVEIAPPPGGHLEVLRLASESELTVYDATYLELAIRKALPLATFDKSLQVAVRKYNLEL